jgi:xanthine dehydrogenase YagS FAD-binding subunit
VILASGASTISPPPAAADCDKRRPGSGCAALEGYNRGHAVLGTSDKCIATHPSDMCVALAALDAVVHAQGPKGARQIPIADFHVAYGEDPAQETVLEHGELITASRRPCGSASWPTAAPWWAAPPPTSGRAPTRP